MNTGQAPTYRTAFAGAMNVTAGISTSSFASTPAIKSAVCRAAVPLTSATPCARPARSAMTRSRRVTNGPADDTQFVSRHSLTYAHSLPPRCGTLNGIFRSAAADTSDAIAFRPVSLKVVLHPRDRRSKAVAQRMPGRPAEQRPRPRRVGAQAIHFASLGPHSRIVELDWHIRANHRHDQHRQIANRDFFAAANVDRIRRKAVDPGGEHECFDGVED